MLSTQTNHFGKGLAQKQGKTRKRDCSSSSSSSLVRKYRFKRAILVGKIGGSSTPVPMWRISTRSPASGKDQDVQSSKPCLPPSTGVCFRDKELSVSARKLAATLWEIHGIPPSRLKEELEFVQNKKEMRNTGKERSEKLLKSGMLRQHLSDPSYSPKSETMNGFGSGNCKRRALTVSLRPYTSDYPLGGVDALGTCCLMEVGNSSLCKTDGKCMVRVKNRLKEVRSGLSASKKLLKVMTHNGGLPEENPSGISLVSALCCELDQLCDQVDQIIQEQRSKQREMEYLMKHFAQEKAAWRRKERKKIHSAIACIAEEYEVEKKLRRQSERLNKKISKELADAKASLSKSMKDLEREKRAKEIMEEICDELARGIGEDRAQVEEMKRESAKVREEVEKEREMLQLADVLREERVQMKLSEAKYHFEEKNAIIEKLRNELEAYLRTKILPEDVDVCQELQKIEELEAYLTKIHYESGTRGDIAEGEEQGEGYDSADSDLHSIELNMDSNNRSYKWSYAGAQDDSGRASIEEEFTRRRSISEKIQWESICFNKVASDSTKGECCSIGKY